MVVVVDEAPTMGAGQPWCVTLPASSLWTASVELSAAAWRARQRRERSA
jgi:hypothetical protein